MQIYSVELSHLSPLKIFSVLWIVKLYSDIISKSFKSSPDILGRLPTYIHNQQEPATTVNKISGRSLGGIVVRGAFDSACSCAVMTGSTISNTWLEAKSGSSISWLSFIHPVKNTAGNESKTTKNNFFIHTSLNEHKILVPY